MMVGWRVRVSEAVGHLISGFVLSGVELGLKIVGFERGARPRRSASGGCEAPDQHAEKRGVRAGRGEMDSDAGSPFDSAVVDLEQAQPKGCAVGPGERRCLWNGAAQNQRMSAFRDGAPDYLGASVSIQQFNH